MDAAAGAGQAVDIVQVKLRGHSRDNTGIPVSVPCRPGTRPGKRTDVAKTRPDKGSEVGARLRIASQSHCHRV